MSDAPEYKNHGYVKLEGDVATPVVEEVVPKLMRYSDIPTAVDMLKQAAAHDPLYIYLTDTPDGRKDSILWRAGWLVIVALSLILNVFHQQAWTVRHGESAVTIEDPQRTTPPQFKIVDIIITRLMQAINNLIRSAEQKKRAKEFGDKWTLAVKEVLGSRAQEMIEVASLATRPDRQGRGYASALVRHATDDADRAHRACYLDSSNTGNRAFYGSLGFVVVHSYEVGTDNPSWEGKPIMLDLMVREPSEKGAYAV